MTTKQMLCEPGKHTPINRRYVQNKGWVFDCEVCGGSFVTQNIIRNPKRMRFKGSKKDRIKARNAAKEEAAKQITITGENDGSKN